MRPSAVVAMLDHACGPRRAIRPSLPGLRPRRERTIREVFAARKAQSPSQRGSRPVATYGLVATAQPRSACAVTRDRTIACVWPACQTIRNYKATEDAILGQKFAGQASGEPVTQISG